MSLGITSHGLWAAHKDPARSFQRVSLIDNNDGLHCTCMKKECLSRYYFNPKFSVNIKGIDGPRAIKNYFLKCLFDQCRVLQNKSQSYFMTWLFLKLCNWILYAVYIISNWKVVFALTMYDILWITFNNWILGWTFKSTYIQL